MASADVWAEVDRAGTECQYGGNATSAASNQYPEHKSVSKRRQTVDKQNRSTRWLGSSHLEANKIEELRFWRLLEPCRKLDLMKTSAGEQEVDPSPTDFWPVPNKIAQPTTEK